MEDVQERGECAHLILYYSFTIEQAVPKQLDNVSRESVGGQCTVCCVM